MLAIYDWNINRSNIGAAIVVTRATALPNYSLRRNWAQQWHRLGARITREITKHNDDGRLVEHEELEAVQRARAVPIRPAMSRRYGRRGAHARARQRVECRPATSR
jgi:hypothetical protein